jgi:hypothetical protein
LSVLRVVSISQPRLAKFAASIELSFVMAMQLDRSSLAWERMKAYWHGKSDGCVVKFALQQIASQISMMQIYGAQLAQR